VKIDFTRSSGKLSFTDCLILPDSHSLSEAEIEALKDERFAKWMAVVTATPTPAEAEPVKEEVTPEMVKAGVEALTTTKGDESEIVRAIYEAMRG
jgi:hypothetical protein